MHYSMLEKSELKIIGIRLDQTNLHQIAKCVADLFGLPQDEVLVIDVRNGEVALDILSDTVDPHTFVGKEKVLLQKIREIPGVQLAEDARITSDGIIGVNPHTYVSAPAIRGISAVGGYSGNAVKPIALRFIAELGQDPALKGMHLSAMGGVESWSDALEYLLLGAGSIQVTTAVMQYGYRIIDDLKAGLNYYLAEKGFAGVKEITGLALDSVHDTTDVLERDTVVFPKFHRENCIGCGRCVLSCADGGHQALRLNEARRPVLDGSRCVGCHLCVLVCPQKAITSSRKRISRRTMKETME